MGLSDHYVTTGGRDSIAILLYDDGRRTPGERVNHV